MSVTVKVTNLSANTAREVCYFKAGRYCVVAPRETCSFECVAQDEVRYYISLQKNDRFRVDVAGDPSDLPVSYNAYVMEEAKRKANQPKEQEVEVKETTPETIETEEEVDLPQIEDPQILDIVPDDQFDEDPYEGLTDQELKSIIKAMGIETSVRARYKLIEVIKDNLPEGKVPQDYLDKK